MEQREDFRSYFEKLRTRPLYRARQLAQFDLLANIEARREALAEARRVGDVKAIERLTRWTLNLALRPRRSHHRRPPDIVFSIGAPTRTPPDADQDESDVEVELIESPEHHE